MKKYRIGIVILFAFVLFQAEANIGIEPTYIVKEGDTLWSIAKAHGLDYGQLCKCNGKPQDWSLIRTGEKIVVGELLDESGDISLFVYKTKSDVEYVKKKREEGDRFAFRNSLFMRRRTEARAYEWRMVMTSEGDWKEADGMDKWCSGLASDVRREFDVRKARLSKDGRTIWMVCDPHIGTYSIICCFDLVKNTFRVLIDGDSVDEQPDGTIFVEGKKTYLSDGNGEPLGAAWYDLWMTPDWKVVRKTKPVTMAEMQKEWAAEQQRKNPK